MKNCIGILFVLCLLCFGSKAKATGQAAEIIIIGQDTLAMLACPLGQDSLLSVQVEERLSKESMSTGLWRGYIGFWRLENGKLYLEKITEEIPDSTGKYTLEEVDIHGIFDAYKENGRILAGWFSGDIRVVQGKQVYYNHMGFDRHYTTETIYTLKKGIVKKQKDIRNSLREATNSTSTLRMIFNGNGMKWDKDSSLSIKVYPQADGSLGRLEVSNRISKPVPEERKAAIQKRMEKKEPGSKARLHLLAKMYKSKTIRYGKRHPYTREVRACLQLMDGWKVLTLDGEIQPIYLSANWKKRFCPWKQNYFDDKDYPADWAEIEGKPYRMDAYPLQQAPDLITHLRTHLKGAFTKQHPRGYEARWKISDNQLWLTEIRNSQTGEFIPLSVLNPSNAGEPIAATWFTGNIELAAGKPLGEYYPYADTEECEILCRVEQGRVVQQKIYRNYIQPGNADEYNHFIEEIRAHDWNSYPELQGRSLHGNLTVYPRTDGSADSIAQIELFVNGDHQTERYHRAINAPDDQWIQIVRQAAEKVTCWEVRFIKGRIESLPITFYIKDAKPQKEKLPEGIIEIDLNELRGNIVIGD